MTPLVEELIPAPDPWDVTRKLSHLPHLLFLDSAEEHPDRGRFSYVMADPLAIGFFSDKRDQNLPANLDIETPEGTVPEYLSACPTEGWCPLPELPPFQGGLAGLFSYQLGRVYEPRVPGNRYDEFQVPTRVLGLYDWLVSFDHQQHRAWLISSGVPELRGWGVSARERLKWGKLHLQRSDSDPRPVDRRKLATHCLAPQYSVPDIPGVTSNFSREGYLSTVQKAIDYIHAGDCFQVNLSQRLLAPLAEHPLELYSRLRERSPAPFSCYFDAGDFQIVSASPEQFLKVTATRKVITRPIKGTRRRGRTASEDAELLADLHTNPKDQAENVMIVDLLRNDLGRVCEYGSVTVPTVCEVETYNYVHHLVSEVHGKLRPGLTAFDLLRAAFPGGSVTGAPKVRAMQIIAELEPTARGAYCGSIGFIGFDGAMDTNILIRTFTAGRGWLQFPVGGGIVADSVPEREYEETLHKAAGLLRALRK